MKNELMFKTVAIFLLHFCFVNMQKCPGDDWEEWDQPCQGCVRSHRRKCKADQVIIDVEKCVIDPCSCHFKMNDEQRSTAFILPKNSAQNNKCDLGLIHAWYRFTSGAGGQMATTCPKDRACGSEGSIWLTGAHPKNFGDVTTLETRLSYEGDCDALQGTNWKIKSKKCKGKAKEKDFYIYELAPVPQCPITYCAGSESRCTGDLSSATGFTPGCTDNFPKLQKDPVLTISQTNKGNIQLKCTLVPLETTANVRHVIQFVQGNIGEIIHETVLKGTEKEAVLQNELTGNKSFWLPNDFSCKVMSYYQDKLNNTGKGKPKKSSCVYAGIKVEPRTLIFKDNEEEKTFSIYSTVGIPDGKCPIHVQFRQDTADVTTKVCKKCFTNTYQGAQNGWKVKVKRKEFDRKSPEKMYIRMILAPSLQKNIRVDWKRMVNEVTVVLQKSGSKTCSATGDPHFRTFDGLYYHMYHVGDYVMMGTKSDKMEVHIRTRVCGSVSCICGLAVRHGDDVVVFDMCRSGLKISFPSKKTLNPAMKITRVGGGGTNYKINTPDAVKIDLNAYPRNYANVYITALSDYREKTIGLCGNSNDNPLDDLEGKTKKYTASQNVIAPLEYTDEWKRPTGSSLFYYRPGKTSCETLNKEFCTCQENVIECGARRKNRWVFDEVEVKTADKIPVECMTNNRRRRNRRSTSNVIIVPDDDDGAGYVYDPVQVNVTTVDFPTKSGMTKQTAIDECTKAVTQSSFGKACLEMYKNLSYTVLVDECVEDAKIMDDIDAPKASIIASFTELCKFTVLEDVTLDDNNNNNNTQNSTTTEETAFKPPPFLVQNLCPNNCNGNGNCVNSTCVCDDGFITDDCSMKNDTVPTVEGISNHGLCDIRKSDCRRVRIIGYNFINSPSLSCRATKVLITDNSTTLTSNVAYDNAYLLTYSELICELPVPPIKIDEYDTGTIGRPSGGFSISMSNDGVSYSGNETLFIVYDGKCMHCNRSGDRVCNQKPKTCKVNNYCFTDSEVNPDDWCTVCDPSVSTDSFSNRTDNVAPSFNTTTFYAIKGQLNKHQLTATDPEGNSFTFRKNDDDQNIEILITDDGLMTWTPTQANRTMTVSVWVEDSCGKGRKQEIVLETRQCPCEGKNGGYCEWKNDGNGKLTEDDMVCRCPDGCQGNNCDEAIEGKVCKQKVKPTDKTGAGGDNGDSNNKKTNIIVGCSVAGAILLLFAVIILVARQKCKTNANNKSTSPVAMKDFTENKKVDKSVVTPVVQFHQNVNEE